MEFAEHFRRHVSDIQNCVSREKVRSKFFTGTDESAGFLKNLIDCLKGQGYLNLVNEVRPVLSENGSLPVMNFGKGIAQLSQEQLRKLSFFHVQMEQWQSDARSGETGVFPPEYKQISHYFDSSEASTENTAQAGRLIMLISAMARSVHAMKEDFEKYTPITLGRYEKLMNDVISSPLTVKLMEKVDQARRAMDYLLHHIDFKGFPLIELEKFRKELVAQKNRFIQMIIIQANKIKASGAHFVTQASRNLKAWIDWESLQRESEAAPVPGQAFDRCLEQMKEDIIGHVSGCEGMSDQLERCLRKKESVSPTARYMLEDVLNLVDTIFSMNITMSAPMRVHMQKTAYRLRNTMKLHDRFMMLENKTLEKYPPILEMKLKYLSREICETLSRGNPKEVKYMSIAFNTSHKNIDNSVAKILLSTGRANDVQQCAQIYRKRFAEIVRTAAHLLRDPVATVS